MFERFIIVVPIKGYRESNKNPSNVFLFVHCCVPSTREFHHPCSQFTVSIISPLRAPDINFVCWKTLHSVSPESSILVCMQSLLTFVCTRKNCFYLLSYPTVREIDIQIFRRGNGIYLKKKKRKKNRVDIPLSINPFLERSIGGQVWGGGGDGMEIKFRRVSSENSSGERGKETRGGRIVCGECPWIIERRGQGWERIGGKERER